MSTTTGTGMLLRRAAAALVGLEAAALVAAAVWFGHSALTRDDAGAMSVALAGLAIVGAVALGSASIALWRGSPWPRGLALTWQVLQCAAGVTMLEWSATAGACALAVAVVAGALLLNDARRDAPAAGSREGSEGSSDPSA